MSEDLRSRILGKKDSKSAARTLPIPEWDNEVVGVRRLSLTERLAFYAENGAFEELDKKTAPEKYDRWLVRYIIATACTPEGARLFAAEDEPEVAGKAGTALERLFIVALKVNYVSAEEIAALGKFSGEAPNGASPSALPLSSA